MNSQIYCLPQKYGWNSIAEISPNRIIEHENYLAWRTPRPYFRIDVERPCQYEEITGKLDRRFLKLDKSDTGDPCRAAQKYVTTSETGAEFTAFDMYPGWTQKTQSRVLSRQPPPVPPRDSRPPPRDVFRRDDRTPPLDVLRLRGWPAMRKVWPAPPDVQDVIWRKSPTYARQQQQKQQQQLHLHHDREHEKRRWDTLTQLGRQDALPYNYRRQMPGFAGHETVQCGALGENKAMVASTRAVHQPFPPHEYRQSGQGHKHQGPLSRAVTLTHPFNPYSQQTAYPSVSATGTQ